MRWDHLDVAMPCARRGTVLRRSPDALFMGTASAPLQSCAILASQGQDSVFSRPACRRASPSRRAMGSAEACAYCMASTLTPYEEVHARAKCGHQDEENESAQAQG